MNILLNLKASSKQFDPPYNFSYLLGNEPLWKRSLITSIEAFFGRNKLLRKYYSAHANQNMFSRLIDALSINIVYNDTSLRRAPTQGPLIIVCNHPYGLMDGIIAINYIRAMRSDFTIVTNTFVVRELKEFQKEVNNNLIVMDFEENPDSQSNNLKARKQARDYLKSGGCIVMFPAGELSKAPDLLGRKPLVECPWHPLVGSLILQCKADVLPMFINGQNSKMFQFISNIGDTAKLGLSALLMYKELLNLENKTIPVNVGNVIPFQSMKGHDKATLVSKLREHTIELGSQ